VIKKIFGRNMEGQRGKRGQRGKEEYRRRRGLVFCGMPKKLCVGRVKKDEEKKEK
jgi:hypothetical protein